MQLFPGHKLYDFMGPRKWFILVSLLMTVASLVLLVTPGPRLGTDFKGGTEIEVAFLQKVTAGELRQALAKAGFHQPDVVGVVDPKVPARFLMRVEAVSTLSEAQHQDIEAKLCATAGAEGCDADHEATEVKFSPGGDKISVRFRSTPDLPWVRERIKSVSSIEMRESPNNPFIQNARDNKVEIQLKSKGDQLMDGLRTYLAPGSVGENSLLRVEWIGPKAGAQLRDSALKAIAVSIVFVMMYIAFRFDIRFAPGAVVAMVHDAVSSIGLLIIMGRELNLSTVAAILTIVGYSVNDTVIVYDRVRENLGRLRGASFVGLINVSISEMLGRTILASGTTVFSLLSFFFFGTGALKDFALTLVMGVIMGTYSSIYVALPFTEWLDQRYFGGKGAVAAKGTYKKQADAVV
ncbi:MAG TPA: protein translocase subunit SecF [Polyangiaceae bacterium]